jgi:AcrR family transcriptional regulator
MKSDETRDALIGALTRLLKTRSVGAVSVRDIAAEAGVNHGLVHRYFGSKEGLVRETVTRISTSFFEAYPEQAQTGWFVRMLRERPELAIIIARTCLDGPHDLLPAAVPPPEVREMLVGRVERAFARTGLDAHVDPNLVNVLFTAAMLGWFAFRPLFEHGYGLGEEVDDALVDLVDRLDGLLDAA